MKTKYAISVMLLLAIVSAAFAAEVDGVISPAEYTRESVFDAGNYRLLWHIDGDKIFMAMDVKAPGWVAIGFEPTSVMANADMIFGMVAADGKTQAIDAWSTGMFGPHPPDTNQGGADSLIASAGTRSGDRVVFEFSRLLATGDKFDKTVPSSGSFKIIWAYGANLQFTAKHTKAGSAVLTMGPQK